MSTLDYTQLLYYRYDAHHVYLIVQNTVEVIYKMYEN